VAVAHELAGTTTSAAETEAVTNVIQTGLEKLHKDVTGNTAAALGLSEVTAELLLHDTILEAKFLLFAESNRIVALFASRTACPVLSRRIRAALERLGGTEKRHTEAAANSICRTCVSSHVSV